MALREQRFAAPAAGLRGELAQAGGLHEREELIGKGEAGARIAARERELGKALEAARELVPFGVLAAVGRRTLERAAHIELPQAQACDGEVRLDARHPEIDALLAGERDTAKRPALAEIAAKYADLFVITQEDPRLEDPAKILAEIEKGAIGAGKQKGTDYLVIDDRTEAVGEAIRRAAPDDTVLLAGKGHEESIIVGEEKRPYDEATTARDALKTIGFGT